MVTSICPAKPPLHPGFPPTTFTRWSADPRGVRKRVVLLSAGSGCEASFDPSNGVITTRGRYLLQLLMLGHVTRTSRQEGRRRVRDAVTGSFSRPAALNSSRRWSAISMFC